VGFIDTFEEQIMSEQTKDKTSNCRGNGKHWGRRARLTIAALTLVGVGAVLGAAATAQASRMGGWHGMGHQWGHAKTEEQARERALDGTAWVLGRIDASAEQQTRINDIVANLVGDLYPLRGEHREYRRQLITELARPQVDAQALEKIRADGLALVDSASKTVVGAVVDVSEVLTIEQREELARMIGRHRR
jgi:protein CpxP